MVRDLASDTLEQQQIYILYSDNSLERTAEVQQGQMQSTFLQWCERLWLCVYLCAYVSLCFWVFLCLCESGLMFILFCRTAIDVQQLISLCWPIKWYWIYRCFRPSLHRRKSLDYCSTYNHLWNHTCMNILMNMQMHTNPYTKGQNTNRSLLLSLFRWYTYS